MATNNSLNINSSNPLDLARGGTSSSIVPANGGVFYSTASGMALVPPTVTGNEPLMSTASGAPFWSAVTYLNFLTANELVYASATNVMAQVAGVDNAVLLNSATGVPTWSSSLTNGQVIIGSTGSIPVANTLTPSTGINIVNGSGTITISATGGGFAWIDQTTTPQTAAIDSGYLVDHGATQVVFTLPVAPALGSTVQIMGSSSGGWQLLPGAGDSIQIGNTIAATSVTSANQYDCLTLVYNGSTLKQWIMVSSVTAGFTIV